MAIYGPGNYPVKLKDGQTSLEFPFFALMNNMHEVREFRTAHGTMAIHPSPLGLPTMKDKAFLIYVLSLVMADYNRGFAIPDKVDVPVVDFLRFCNRSVGGHQYRHIEDSLLRLSGSILTMKRRNGDEFETRTTHFLDNSRVVRMYGPKGNLKHLEVAISDWMLELIRKKRILTLHDDYFLLKKPLEQRLYEIARQFCGRNEKVEISTRKLLAKTGSTMPHYLFLANLRRMAATPLLDYQFRISKRKGVKNQEVIISRVPKHYAREEKPTAGDSPEVAERKDARPENTEWKPKTTCSQEDLDAYRDWIDGKGIKVNNNDRLFEKFMEKRPKPMKMEEDMAGMMHDLKYLWWAKLPEGTREEYRNLENYGWVGDYDENDNPVRRKFDDDAIPVRIFEMVFRKGEPKLTQALAMAILEMRGIKAADGNFSFFKGFKEQMTELDRENWVYYLLHQWKAE